MKAKVRQGRSVFSKLFDSPDFLEYDERLSSHLERFESHDVQDLAELGHDRIDRLLQIFFLDLLVQVLDVDRVVGPSVHRGNLILK